MLDTNAYSLFLRGDQLVLDELARADIIYMSIIVLAELYYGYSLGTKEAENREKLDTFLLKPIVFQLDASKETAEIFALVKRQLKEAGAPIPINDVWIAAHAIEMGAMLLTYDRHFLQVPGLRLWREIS